jgi:hypothetical protein
MSLCILPESPARYFARAWSPETCIRRESVRIDFARRLATVKPNRTMEPTAGCSNFWHLYVEITCLYPKTSLVMIFSWECTSSRHERNRFPLAGNQGKCPETDRVFAATGVCTCRGSKKRHITKYRRDFISPNKLELVPIANEGTILNGMKRVFNPFDLVPIRFGIGSVASPPLRISAGRP